MPLESKEIVHKIAKEFMELKKFFEKVGFEIIGTKTDSDNTIYLIKKKNDPRS